MNSRQDRIGRWIVWLFILFTVMYFGAHVIASIIKNQG